MSDALLLDLLGPLPSFQQHRARAVGAAGGSQTSAAGSAAGGGGGSGSASRSGGGSGSARQTAEVGQTWDRPTLRAHFMRELVADSIDLDEES